MREAWLNFGHERDKEPSACRSAPASFLDRKSVAG
jgi:hypothetical protein